MCNLSMIIVWMFLSIGVLYSQPNMNPKAIPRPQETAPVSGSRVAIPPGPVIKAFTVSPHRLDRRVNLVFSWQVEPSRTGSPVAEVKVVAGAIALHTTAAATGTYTFSAREWMYRSVLPPGMNGRKNFKLVAKTAAGASESREVTIEVVSVVPIINSFIAMPTSPIRLGETIRVRWGIMPGPSAIPIRSIVIEEMAEDGSGRHRLYSGAETNDEVRVETESSTRPGVLRYSLTVTNEEGIKAESEIRATLMRAADIIQKPDMVLEIRDCSWFFVGLTPKLRVYYTIHNRGEFRTGLFSIRFMAWRGRGEYLVERQLYGSDIAPGEQRQNGLTLSADDLRGSTELYFNIDPHNRVAESNESNNEIKIAVPPMPR